MAVKNAMVISVYKAGGGYSAAASEVRSRDAGMAWCGLPVTRRTAQLLHHAVFIQRYLYSAGQAVGKHRRYAVVDDVSNQRIATNCCCVACDILQCWEIA